MGVLWRSAMNFGAAFIFTIGRRYAHQHGDVPKTPRHVPLWHFDTEHELLGRLPRESALVGIELVETATPLRMFQHPERAIYLLGDERKGLPEHLLKQCSAIIAIDTPFSLNVSVAGSIVMYDRSAKAACRAKGVRTL